MQRNHSYIYGLPHQTHDSFYETYDWCRTHTTAKVVAFPLMLLRGTPLYENRHALGLIEGHIDDDVEDTAKQNSFSGTNNGSDLGNDKHFDRLAQHISHVSATPHLSSTDFLKIHQHMAQSLS
eukprot:m.111593 g.111593  ORF g.111593 m.111593 type:complete len:123 (+) comp9238_c2_seq1:1080-1448(+)